MLNVQFLKNGFNDLIIKITLFALFFYTNQLREFWFYLIKKLNKKPVKIIPIATIEAKIIISLVFITFFKIINSGKDKAVTAIIKARDVPMATPFSVRALTRGITPAALEYKGIPINTDTGTAYHLSAPAY